jgi:hypothetical protein
MHPELMTMEEPDEEGLVRPASRLNIVRDSHYGRFAAGGNGCEHMQLLIVAESKARNSRNLLVRWTDCSANGEALGAFRAQRMMELNPLQKKYSNVLERIQSIRRVPWMFSAIPRQDCTCVISCEHGGGVSHTKDLEIVNPSDRTRRSHDSPGRPNSGSNVLASHLKASAAKLST